mgnify:CR=1 FL=1
MSIDAVIAQARRPGSFSERKRFTIARTQAIQKLRQFALADSSAYILELIQSAIGNGAVWIDIHQDDRGLTLAYIGGGLPESALTRLFDFLFAAKDRTDIGPYRDLAHGINAMLAREPSRIVVESGDGTRAGTTRLELHAGDDRFDVGRPDHTLTGTFVRAEGLSAAGRERAIVESRCRLAPIPIVFNGESLFGFSTRKIPSLPGYARTIVFDEGDLYGILGCDERIAKPTIELLTRGVIIEELEQTLVEGARFGGVINFDALHKSADHARIVRDDRLAELWLRVRPYAYACARGEAARPNLLDVRVWDGPHMTSIPDIRAWLHASKRVVVARRGVPPGSDAAAMALQIAAALDAKLALTMPDQVKPLRLLAGGNVAIYHPNLDTRVDLDFYTSAPAPAPPRPWVVQPVDVPPIPAADLRPQLAEAASAVDPLWTPTMQQNPVPAILEQLGESSELRARVYTPTAADDPATVEVQLLSAGRLLHTVALASPHAGHVLVAELPDVSPSRMLGPRTGGRCLADLLAAALLAHADATLAEAASRALAGLAHRDGPLRTVEAHRALEVLARTAVLQFRRRDGRPTLEFALLEPGPPGVDLLALPVLPTHHGDPISLRTLAAVMTERGGRIPTDHAEPHPSLRPDAATRPHLRAIVGELALQGVPQADGRTGPTLAAFAADGRNHPISHFEEAFVRGRRIALDHRPDLPVAETTTDDIPDELDLTPAAFLALSHPNAVPAFDFDFDEPAFIASVPLRTAEVEGRIGVPLVRPARPAVVVLDLTRRRVHRYVELAHDFGVVGVLRMRAFQWSPEHAAVVAQAIAGATGELYDALLARVPTMPPDSPGFACAAAAMLSYAGRRLDLVADPHGRVAIRPVQATADRVLHLPLFPGRRGLPLGAWHLVQRFAEAAGDKTAALAEVDESALPPVLKDWLHAALDPARISTSDARDDAPPQTPGRRSLSRLGATDALPDEPAGSPVDLLTLAATLEYWLHQLRPDLPPNNRPWDRRGRVRLVLEGSRAIDGFAAVEGDAAAWSITLDPQHWLLRWAAAKAQDDRQPIAWLLLACYARINEQFDDVTNSHEGLFQRAVADALERGQLDLLTPRFD